jgi:hypothetical protein
MLADYRCHQLLVASATVDSLDYRLRVDHQGSRMAHPDVLGRNDLLHYIIYICINLNFLLICFLFIKGCSGIPIFLFHKKRVGTNCNPPFRSAYFLFIFSATIA